MITEPNSEINNKYILVLNEDKNKFLSVDKIMIDELDDFVEEIKTRANDPRYTIWDLRSLVFSKIENTCDYNYCYPFEYNERFIGPALCPKNFSFKEYREYFEKFKIEINKRWPNKSEEELQEKVISHELSLKESYAQKAIRYIKCQQLNKAIKEALRKNAIYSSDSIGWTTFKYTISEDMDVIIKTNFVYGSSAYFYLAVKYKGIVLVPYSDLVHYYYANMKDFISYTRAYKCRRDSWHYAFGFLADFVNKSISEPTTFIRTYVLTELEDMMNGLRETMLHPYEVLQRIKGTSSEYLSFRVIRPFNSNDDAIYKMFPKESVVVFKAEKISGALAFVNGLSQLVSICPEITPILEEIIKMNSSIKDEVICVAKSINDDLELVERKQECKLKESNLLDNRIKYYEYIINKKQRNKPTEEHEIIKQQYMKQHPQYEKLLKDYDKIQKEICELGDVIKKRTNLKGRMATCLDLINKNL